MGAGLVRMLVCDLDGTLLMQGAPVDPAGGVCNRKLDAGVAQRFVFD